MTVPRVDIFILQRIRQANVLFVILVCVIIANLWILHFFYRKYEAQQLAKAQAATKIHSHLQVGQIMPRFSARSLDDTFVDSSSYQGKWLLAIYYGTKLNPNHLTQSQALFEKYSNVGFQPLAIINEPRREIREEVAGDISYPLILDPDHSIGNTLHLHGEETGTFFVDPYGEIKFSLPDIPNQSNLRQLVERFVLRRSTHETDMSAPSTLKTGGSIPEFRIKDVRTGKELGSNELDLINASMIFFGADCSACQISSYLDAIQNISLSDKASARFYLIFSKDFSSYDLANRLNSRGLNLSVYVARNELETLSPYATKSAFGEEAILITTGGQGQIKSVNALTKWLAGLNSNGVK